MKNSTYASLEKNKNVYGNVNSFEIQRPYDDALELSVTCCAYAIYGTSSIPQTSEDSFPTFYYFGKTATIENENNDDIFYKCEYAYGINNISITRSFPGTQFLISDVSKTKQGPSTNKKRKLDKDSYLSTTYLGNISLSEMLEDMLFEVKENKENGYEISANLVFDELYLGEKVYLQEVLFHKSDFDFANTVTSQGITFEYGDAYLLDSSDSFKQSIIFTNMMDEELEIEHDVIYPCISVIDFDIVEYKWSKKTKNEGVIGKHTEIENAFDNDDKMPLVFIDYYKFEE